MCKLAVRILRASICTSIPGAALSFQTQCAAAQTSGVPGFAAGRDYWFVGLF